MINAGGLVARLPARGGGRRRAAVPAGRPGAVLRRVAGRRGGGEGALPGLPDPEACLAGALERREPWGVWGGELFIAGVVVARKRPRGRPRKHPVRAVVPAARRGAADTWRDGSASCGRARLAAPGPSRGSVILRPRKACGVTSALFETARVSDARSSASAASQHAARNEAPIRVERGVLAPRPSACPGPSLRCRRDEGASRQDVQSRSDHSVERPALESVGVAGQELLEHLAKGARAFSWASTASPPSQTRWISRYFGGRLSFIATPPEARVAHPDELLAHPVAGELELRHGGRLDERAPGTSSRSWASTSLTTKPSTRSSSATWSASPFSATRRIRPIAGGRPSGNRATRPKSTTPSRPSGSTLKLPGCGSACSSPTRPARRTGTGRSAARSGVALSSGGRPAETSDVPRPTPRPSPSAWRRAPPARRTPRCPRTRRRPAAGRLPPGCSRAPR